MEAFQNAIMKILGQTPGLRNIATLGEDERNAEFYCPCCDVRVYPTYPSHGNPYFSARGSEKHKQGCMYHKKDLFQKVSHLDHTGTGVDLEELMIQLRHSDRRPQGKNGESDDTDFRPTKELEDAEKSDPRMLRVAVHPRTLHQLYGILSDPDVKDYAGRRVSDLIVDKRTIHYHRMRGLDQIALIVGGRCYPPEDLETRLKSDGVPQTYLCLRAPYPCSKGEKEIYYILQFTNQSELSGAYDVMQQKQTAKKFLAIARWTPYFSTETFDAYFGVVPSTGAFRALQPQDDCDE